MEPNTIGCTVNLCEQTRAALIKREEDPASPGNVVDVMLQRYFDLMYLTLGNLWQIFTEPEMLRIPDQGDRGLRANVTADSGGT